MPTQNKFYVVVPARYASSRLPGKALEDIGGMPMVLRVYRQAELSGAAEVLIATDDERIATAARRAGASVELTSEEHESGTDRIAEIVERLGWPADRIVVNVQGDEPLIPPALISQTAELLASEPRASIATLATDLRDAAEFRDPNTAKVVVDKEGFAMYFSRAPIPWPRDGMPTSGLRRHIGLYAYRVAPLLAIAREGPCEIELIEKLEQLRALWLGHRIVVADAVERPPAGVDTAADLAAARLLFEG